MTYPNLHFLWLCRYLWMGQLLCVLLGVGALAVLAWYPPASSLHFGIRLLGVPTGVVLILALSFWLQWRTVRLFRERLRQAKGRLCLRCRYSLVGHGDTGRCPECDEPFNIAEVLKHWRKLRGWEKS